MTAIQTWAALAQGRPVELDATEAARMIEVLRRSYLDGLPIADTADLARRILAAVKGGPALFADNEATGTL